MEYLLCKFVPPRPAFLATMTPTESALMKQHGLFMNDLLDKRPVVAQGPVDDPAGGCGRREASRWPAEVGRVRKRIRALDKWLP